MFNPKTLFGYTTAALFETGATYCLCLSSRFDIWIWFYIYIKNCIFNFSAALGFLIASCWLLVTIAEDISKDVKLLDGVETPKEHRKIFFELLDYYIDARQLSEMIYFRIEQKFVKSHLIQFKFFHRYVEDFCDIFRIIITAIFLWTLSTIGSSLVVLQTEIVKSMHFNQIRFKRIIQICISVKRIHWNNTHIDNGILVIRIDFTLLWNWWTIDRWIRMFRSRAVFIRLVFISDRFTANTRNSHDVHSKIC